MSTDSPHGLQVDQAKRRRANRKGQITKLKNRVQDLRARQPEDYAAESLVDLQEELKTQIAEYNHQQQIIDELIINHSDVLPEDETELDRTEESFIAFKSSLSALIKARLLWDECAALQYRVDDELSNPSPNSASFRATAEKLDTQYASIAAPARPLFKAFPPLKDPVMALEDSMKKLRHIVREADKVPSAIPPTPASSPPTPTATATSHSTLHIEVPSFDGNPEKWEQFESLSTSTVRTRAKGFSPMEIRGLLRSAVKPDRARRILDNLPSTTCDLDEMIAELRSIYGSASVMGPLLAKKIQSVNKLGFDYASLTSFYDQFCLPWQRFVSISGDSLSNYLAVTAVELMTDPCRDEWLRTTDSTKVPCMEDISAFVKRWMLKFPDSNSSAPPSASPSISIPSQPFRKKIPEQPLPRKPLPGCPACNQSHGLLRCPTFNAMDTERRNKLVRDHKLCLNCFSSQHGFRQCPGRFSCKTCDGRHHTMLHRDNASKVTPATPPSPATATPSVLSLTAATTTPIQSESRFLLTATVTLKNDSNTVIARAILDTGAAISFMTESTATALKLKRRHTPLQVAGTTGESQCKFSVSTQLHSHDLSFTSDPIQFTVLPKLPTLQVPPNRKELLEHPTFRSYKLADPELGGRVDLLLGVTDSLSLFTGEALRVQGLLAMPTQLGLCISGPMLNAEPPLALMATVPPTDLQQDLGKLWELDQVPEAPKWSPEDQAVLNEFQQTHQRIERRFSVSLPRVSDPPPLGNSRRQAVSRLLANERSLAAKDKLTAFQSAVREYIDMGHAHIIPRHQLHDLPHFYLPVHGVFKDSSSTTKVRAVFDASARSSSGFSLNDQLLPGPNLYPPLQDILLRFRRFPIGMSADISKMFREILLNLPERNFHRFLMRDREGHITDCRMDRLTFGVKCSPFLATQVLHTLAQLHTSSHPAASSAILENFYVDDFLSGAVDVESADSLRREICDLLSHAGMVLRKWRSNSPALLALIPDDLHDPSSSIPLQDPSLSPKALGVHWVQTDSLHVSIPDVPPSTSSVTKRSIASATAGVFDVLGLFAPAILPARVLFQETWKRALSWDEPVPDDMASSWCTWVEDLHSVNGHAIPRRISCSVGVCSEELHGFCDASSYAYGAAIYLRSTPPEGSTTTSLITAKSRVLPVRPVTIPKAELLGAHLLAKLIHHTCAILHIPLSHVHAWTDSEIVLHWLPKTPPQLERFVANRVFAIQQLLPSVHWHHVPTNSNPADLASRGVRAPDLAMSALWWSGPLWLALPPDQWPHSPISKPSVPALVASIRPPPSPPQQLLNFVKSLWSRYSSFFLLVRVCCLLFRFSHNCRSSSDLRRHGPISSEEVEHAKFTLYRLAQTESFNDVFSYLRKDTPIPKNHSLARYLLTLSKHGHLQAHSRIRDPDTPTQPVLLTVLPKSSALTKLLLRTLHIAYSHAGVSAMLSIISHTYLIPSLRSLLKQVSRSCVVCQRAYARPLAHCMGLLPSVRTTPAPPFTHTGVDFAGPFTLRTGHTRKPVYLKAYAVVFVCMVTRAVHFDLASSLSTTEFLATLERFVARRGVPSSIHSDNGSNFLGAREEIRELQRFSGNPATQDTITQFATKHDITWKHTPPRSPHFGGLWEAAVRSMKTHLRKTTGKQPLRWDELYSVLVEAESILNSRPLAPISTEEAADLSFITAGHFLIGRPLKAPPSKQPSTSPISHLRRWNLVTRLKADLWKKWSASYLSSISQRSKWFRPSLQLRPGDIVFVKDETLRTRDWPIAKVIKTYPGDDGVVRVVDIICRGTTYRRPVVKLVLALTDDEIDANRSQAEDASSSTPST